MASSKFYFYDTDYDTDDGITSSHPRDPFLLIRVRDSQDFLCPKDSDIVLVKEKSSYYNFLKKRGKTVHFTCTYVINIYLDLQGAGPIKEQFLVLEKSHIELQRAIRLCQQARHLLRSLINTRYGYPSDETSTSGNTAEQRIQDTTDNSRSGGLCPSLRKGNDGYDS